VLPSIFGMDVLIVFFQMSWVRFLICLRLGQRLQRFHGRQIPQLMKLWEYWQKETPKLWVTGLLVLLLCV